MSPIQQMLLGVGAVATKTYVDDVFSTYVYKGTGSARSINNGINLSGEGGMVWTKGRDIGLNNNTVDTARGAGKRIRPNTNSAELTDTDYLSAFNSNGFSLGTNNVVNGDGNKYASWTFRKAPGFFSCISYSGSGSYKTVAHDLGCVPGMYMIKRTDTTADWRVFHRSLNGPGWRLVLNTDEVENDLYSLNQNTSPTSSVFSVGSDSTVNASGGTYICYLFAGGESGAATARSVDFNGSDYISQPSHSDFYGIQDQAFTVEYWMKADAFSSSQNGGAAVLGASNPTTNTEVWSFGTKSTGEVIFYYYNGSVQIETTGVTLTIGVWNHLALVHDGSNGFKIFVNGILVKSGTISGSITQTAPFSIGKVSNGQFDGKISNVRVVHAAVYTSSFRPPTEPLTNITNTKLLCCNDSSVTGSTVTTGTITSSDSPTASTDSPFDDPAGFVFGENEDQGIIKCGSYKSTGNGDWITVDLGFEPQFIIVKDTDSANDWFMQDCVRGMPVDVGNHDDYVLPNTNGAEGSIGNAAWIQPTPTGFIATTAALINWFQSSRKYIYIAVRRHDGYVGKPPELGTDVFAMATGTSSADPQFVSGFTTDFMLRRAYASSTDWLAGSRLTGTKYLIPNSNAAESTTSGSVWDYMNGMGDWSQDTTSQLGWNWKRHAGFDVVTYEGDATTNRQIPHSLSKIPEMIWTKDRDYANGWAVYHKGLNGGTNPEQYNLMLDENSAEVDSNTRWNDTAPTSTHFTVGNSGYVNRSGDGYIAMLFASVDGISKVGYFDGQDSTITITTGFAPRFLIIKRITGPDGWLVFDTTRGWGSGNDYRLMLDSSTSQSAPVDYGAPTSTGFTMTTRDSTNASGEKYIYYAHA